METPIQKRLALLNKARQHSAKMEKGSAFVTDFTAKHIIDEMAEALQEMLAENLKLKEEIKSIKVFHK